MSTDKKLLYGDLTYKIRGAMFAVHKALGSGHKEIVYQMALAREFQLANIPFVIEKILDIIYRDKKVGTYRPDFVVDDKVIIELKAVSFLTRDTEVQMSYYLRGSNYSLGLLVNFGSRRLEIRRRIYTIRANP